MGRLGGRCEWLGWDGRSLWEENDREGKRLKKEEEEKEEEEEEERQEEEEVNNRREKEGDVEEEKDVGNVEVR